MLNLHTGLPGASKTLYTLSYVKAMAEKDNRPVFYAGIKDLMLPWTEIDALKWFECPPGAIIVIDECQTYFRPRSFGSNVPDYVAKLETHRHAGHDLFLITQHPMLVDPSIRRLAGRHIHIVRKWGFAASTLHEWGSVRENCDKPAGRTDSIKHHWKFDKAAYSYYKSAEVHTVKRNLPFRLVMLFVILPALIAFLAWRFYSSVKARTTEASAPVTQTSGGKVSGSAGRGGGERRVLDPVADAREYAYMNTPRITGLTYTAPKYDEVVRPVTAPVPVACVSSTRRCSCYSQQGTVLDVTEAFCRETIQRGYFVDFELKHGERHDERAARSQTVLERPEGLPLSGAGASQVMMVGGRSNGR
jgi:zona occludens toxin